MTERTHPPHPWSNHNRSEGQGKRYYSFCCYRETKWAPSTPTKHTQMHKHTQSESINAQSSAITVNQTSRNREEDWDDLDECHLFILNVIQNTLKNKLICIRELDKKSWNCRSEKENFGYDTESSSLRGLPSESILLRAVGGMMDTLHWPRGHLRG